jgi:hypothetical protein
MKRNKLLCPHCGKSDRIESAWIRSIPVRAVQAADGAWELRTESADGKMTAIPSLDDLKSHEGEFLCICRSCSGEFWTDRAVQIAA